ncbi:pentapeptide repeat-containing protein, partial [Spirillospora sp. NPDC048819]|uniref:pentapeptide repeat-containing protein n=1 Tax=Spirillospora sp. NPDC048819 TaxID=3155268 RepID=UPI00340983F1
MLFGVAAVGLAIWVSTWWMLAQTHGLSGAAEATARMNAIKTGLSVGAGTGGAVALLLAMRRQWLSERDQLHREQVADTTHSHAERVALASEHDAAERRVTELYSRAADQLASDKAPVRLAGLYALERLAQDNPTQRQTIVNVICAYLRMPFAPERPATRSADELEAIPPEARGSARTEDESSVGQWEQERVVRLTAQGILTKHLHARDNPTEWPRSSTPEGPDFWPSLNLNLSEATLLEFSGAGITVNVASFSGTRFVGGANFAHANFEQHAHFHRARFEGGSAHFLGAWFGLRAVFVGVALPLRSWRPNLGEGWVVGYRETLVRSGVPGR